MSVLTMNLDAALALMREQHLRLIAVQNQLAELRAEMNTTLARAEALAAMLRKGEK